MALFSGMYSIHYVYSDRSYSSKQGFWQPHLSLCVGLLLQDILKHVEDTFYYIHTITITSLYLIYLFAHLNLTSILNFKLWLLKMSIRRDRKVLFCTIFQLVFMSLRCLEPVGLTKNHKNRIISIPSLFQQWILGLLKNALALNIYIYISNLLDFKFFFCKNGFWKLQKTSLDLRSFRMVLL